MTFSPNGSSYLCHSQAYLGLSRLLTNSLNVDAVSDGYGGSLLGAILEMEPSLSRIPGTNSHHWAERFDLRVAGEGNLTLGSITERN